MVGVVGSDGLEGGIEAVLSGSRRPSGLRGDRGIGDQDRCQTVPRF